MNISIKSLNGDKIILKMKGSNVNFSTVNTLRRIILSEIPTFAMSAENIHIEKNTSIFDNDQMRTRIGLLPIPKISNDIEYFYENGEYDQDKIDIYLNTVNDTPDIMNVTTNEYVVFVNGEEIENPYDKDRPSLVIKLRPKEEINWFLSAMKSHMTMSAMSSVSASTATSPAAMSGVRSSARK